MNEYQTKKQLREKIQSLEIKLKNANSMWGMYQTSFYRARKDKEEQGDLVKDVVKFLAQRLGIAENYGDGDGELNLWQLIDDVEKVSKLEPVKEARKRLGIKKGSDNGN